MYGLSSRLLALARGDLVVGLLSRNLRSFENISLTLELISQGIDLNGEHRAL